MIQVTAIGRIGTAAQARQAGQSTVVGFSLACETREKDQQTNKQKVDWYTVDVWGQMGTALAQYLVKGQQVAVCGRLEMKTFANAQGVQQTKPTITAGDIKLLQSPKPQPQAAPEQQQQMQMAPPGPPRTAVHSNVSTPTGQVSQADLDALFSDDTVIPF